MQVLNNPVAREQVRKLKSYKSSLALKYLLYKVMKDSDLEKIDTTWQNLKNTVTTVQAPPRTYHYSAL